MRVALRWGTFVPNLGTLGLWVLELFAMYTTDGQTDGGTDKSNAYCSFPTGAGHNNRLIIIADNEAYGCKADQLLTFSLGGKYYQLS